MLMILGNQLFPPECLSAYKGHEVFMAEDMGLCTYERHHQQKIVLFLAAMRSYADELRATGFDVHYEALNVDGKQTYEARLKAAMQKAGSTELVHFEIEDKLFEARVEAMVAAEDFTHTVVPSPMFSCDRERFAQFIDGKKRLLMGDFYKQQRHRLDILIDADGEPEGGQYSYDADNRKKLPRNVEPPIIDAATQTDHVTNVMELVLETFADHPGSASDFWWPTTRKEARSWLAEFVEARLESFGPYEDAMTTRSKTVFHSVLSPMINMGLLLPDEVVDAVVAKSDAAPLPSVEGFVRQVIGWREFIRGIYQNFSEQQDESNFWSHQRELTDDWYDATTGIVPLDDAIKTAQSLGWAHQIPRLMVLGNLMTLCEIRPTSAHRWFMEMFVDSSEWVMGPNVYGMGLFSDGGIFATKPYICGSNYLRKMSDYPKGEWCDVVDGLYWRFIDKHRDFFAGNPRLALMPRALDRLADDRRERIFGLAETFLESKTN